jgi:hypothetical protein
MNGMTTVQGKIMNNCNRNVVSVIETIGGNVVYLNG